MTEINPPQTSIFVPVQATTGLFLGGGALVVVVATHESVLGLYFPPRLSGIRKLPPPQTIISVPVQTQAEELNLVVGAPVVVVAVQLFNVGSYLPPVL